jgi:glycosyltransferase involved in cell wall biosynthesis
MPRENFAFDVVIPVFNGSDWISSCVNNIQHNLKLAGLDDAKIYVVDDGSTDNLEEVLKEVSLNNLTIIRQENLGRLQARVTGAKASHADFILFIDSRVELHPSSLPYVLPFLKQATITTWTCHVEPHVEGNIIARFWHVIEYVFWSRYFKSPSLTLISSENFDYFPKGTTALIAPRIRFLEAAESCLLSSRLSNARKINDDTSVLRSLTEKEPIAISPQYKCTYYARNDFKRFLKHANHRGAVLIDGHWRRGTRLRHFITASFLIVPLAILLLTMYPLASLASVTSILIAVFAYLTLNVPGPINALVFVTLLIPFSGFYFLGMCHGALLRITGLISHNKQRSRRSKIDR